MPIYRSSRKQTLCASEKWTQREKSEKSAGDPCTRLAWPRFRKQRPWTLRFSLKLHLICPFASRAISVCGKTDSDESLLHLGKIHGQGDGADRKDDRKTWLIV